MLVLWRKKLYTECIQSMKYRKISSTKQQNLQLEKRKTQKMYLAFEMFILCKLISTRSIQLQQQMMPWLERSPPVCLSSGRRWLRNSKTRTAAGGILSPRKKRQTGNKRSLPVLRTTISAVHPSWKPTEVELSTLLHQSMVRTGQRFWLWAKI